MPLKLYFNDQGRAKLELALAKGKKLHDKRETEKRGTGDGKRPASCGIAADLSPISTNRLPRHSAA